MRPFLSLALLCLFLAPAVQSAEKKNPYTAEAFEKNLLAAKADGMDLLTKGKVTEAHKLFNNRGMKPVFIEPGHIPVLTEDGKPVCEPDRSTLTLDHLTLEAEVIYRGYWIAVSIRDDTKAKETKKEWTKIAEASKSQYDLTIKQAEKKGLFKKMTKKEFEKWEKDIKDEINDALK